jgi:hypothetical protein
MLAPVQPACAAGYAAKVPAPSRRCGVAAVAGGIS